jgi:hypothetical protein
MAAFRFGFRLLAVLTLLLGLAQAGLAAVTAEQILGYRPAQKIEVSTPAKDEVSNCTVELEETGKAANGKATTAWVVKDGRGNVLRKFHDTTGNGGVNMFAYYKDGEEVYREIDTNGKGKISQYRWLNSAGSKWGLDIDEDGKIDGWLVISAEELSQEVLQAVVAKDQKRLEALMMTPADMNALGLPPGEAGRIRNKLAGAVAQFQKSCTDLKGLTDKAQWVHLEAKLPQTTPADVLKSKEDLVRHRNAAILFQESDDPKAKHEWLQLGELVQVGKAWRIIQGPVVGINQIDDGPGAIDPETSLAFPAGSMELAAELTKLDVSGPKPGREGKIEFNLARVAVLEKIAGMFKNAEDAKKRDPWLRQVAESLSAAAQEGDKAALQRLGQWKGLLPKESSALPYFIFREMTAQYAQDISKVGPKPEDLIKLQETWKGKLTKFIGDYPTVSDTPDAYMQLGIVNEFFGAKTEEEAKTAYATLVKNFPKHSLAKRAQGCLDRITLEGKELDLSGPALGTGNFTDVSRLKGKAVVVYFWASWNDMALSDFTKIKAAMATYAGKVELLGVNLDSKSSDASTFLKSTPVEAAHIYMAGGQDNPIAIKYGINAIPVMFVVGPDGKVVNRQAQAVSLDDDLKKLFKAPEKDK